VGGWSDVATRLAAAVAIPIRMRVLAAFAAAKALTVPELAAGLGVETATVERHVRELEELDLIVRVPAEGREPVYATRSHREISDDEYVAMPLEIRRSYAASTLTQLYAGAAASIDRGGFDRSDVQLTSVFLDLDEAGWKQLVALMHGTYYAVRDMAERSEGGTGGVRAIAMQMLFTDEPSVAGEETDDAPPFSEDEAHGQAVELLDALREAVTGPASSWEEVVALTDRLRVVARAAAVAPTRE
jgi:DNA-binding transcriptional ArsR family regulator